MQPTYRFTKIGIQVVSALILSFLFGWLTIKLASFISMKYLVAGLTLFGIGLVILVVLRLYAWRFSWDVALVHLLIITAFVGPGLIAVSFGGFSLFPFRLMFALMMVLSLFRLYQARNNLDFSGAVHQKWFLLFFGFWVLYGFVSLFWVQSLSMGVKDFILLFTGVAIIFFVVSFFQNEKVYVHFYFIWIFMFAFFVLIGLWNHFALHPLPISRVYGRSEALRAIPTAVFTNENDFSSFLAISMLLTVPWLKHSRSWMIRGLGGVLLLLAFYLIVLDSSRANILSIFLGLVVWFLAFTSRDEKMKILMGLLIVVPFGILLFSQKVIHLIQKVAVELDSLSNVSSGSVNIRENLLGNVMVFFTNSFGFGIGVGNAPYYMANYEVYGTSGDVNVHNWWAEILVDYGLVIFVGYLLVFLALIIYLFRLSRTLKDRRQKMISEGLALALIVFIGASISPSSFIGLKYNWLLIAFAVGFVNVWYHQFYSSRRINAK